jgi:outer membrane protein OmpA-like peptidoglycan-associated protein
MDSLNKFPLWKFLFALAFFFSGFAGLYAQEANNQTVNLKHTDRSSRGKDVNCADAVSIYYYNKEVGFAIDKKGIVRKKRDGGSTWHLVKINTEQTIRAIHFSVVNVGYAVGDSGIILKTENGGKEWKKLASITNKNLFSVYFSDLKNGYVIGENGTILKTSDGDLSWKHLGTNCSLSSSPEGTTFTLHKVYFNKSKYDLLSESFAELDTLAKYLLENPTIEIEISGHTDSQGDSHDNQKLSENRAKAVKEYLVSKKIDPDRIKCKGYGETKPIASNDMEETRRLNRRVEFVILKR